MYQSNRLLSSAESLFLRKGFALFAPMLTFGWLADSYFPRLTISCLLFPVFVSGVLRNSVHASQLSRSIFSSLYVYCMNRNPDSTKTSSSSIRNKKIFSKFFSFCQFKFFSDLDDNLTIVFYSRGSE